MVFRLQMVSSTEKWEKKIEGLFSFQTSETSLRGLEGGGGRGVRELRVRARRPDLGACGLLV